MREPPNRWNWKKNLLVSGPHRRVELLPKGPPAHGQFGGGGIGIIPDVEGGAEMDAIDDARAGNPVPGMGILAGAPDGDGQNGNVGQPCDPQGAGAKRRPVENRIGFGAEPAFGEDGDDASTTKAVNDGPGGGDVDAIAIQRKGIECAVEKPNCGNAKDLDDADEVEHARGMAHQHRDVERREVIGYQEKWTRAGDAVGVKHNRAGRRPEREPADGHHEFVEPVGHRTGAFRVKRPSGGRR